MNKDIEFAERRMQQGKLVSVLNYWLKKRNDEINESMKTTYCPSCYQDTRSVRIGRAHHECENCSYDKTLNDVFLNDALRGSSIRDLLGD